MTTRLVPGTRLRLRYFTKRQMVWQFCRHVPIPLGGVSILFIRWMWLDSRLGLLPLVEHLTLALPTTLRDAPDGPVVRYVA